MDEIEDPVSIAPLCLTDLLDELLEYICCCPSLDFRDIVNMSFTCPRLFAITQRNKIWTNKWKIKWPLWERSSPEDEERTAFQNAFLMEKSIVKKLSTLSSKAFDHVEVPYCFLREFSEIHNNSETLLGSVLKILYFLACGDDRMCDLNQKYYAQKVYIYLYHQKLIKSWEKLLSSPQGEDTARLETGAFLISQWCNPMMVLKRSDISEQIDSIASLIRNKMSNNDNHLQTLNAMNKVLYNELNFSNNANDYYDINNSFIDQVLKRKLGIPISLGVLYITVAKRLGLDIEGVNFPGHFLCRFITQESGKNTTLYIDAFNKGLVMDQQQCIAKFISNFHAATWPLEMLFQVADDRKIFIRMVGNIINILKEKVIMNARNLSSLRSAHELMSILAPHDTNNHLILSKIDQHLRLDLERYPQNTVTPKVRSAPKNSVVKYRVGMIMKHRRYNYFCVIYGWDCECQMDSSWQSQMNVQRLENRDKQPFYHVLAHDASSRYAAEENLVPVEDSSAGPIANPEVGKYFNSFSGTFYIMTDRKSVV